MNKTLFELRIGEKFDIELANNVKEEVASKGVILGSDLANDPFYVALHLFCSEVDGYFPSYAVALGCYDTSYIRKYYRDKVQSDGIKYDVTIELVNGIQISFSCDMDGDEKYFSPWYGKKEISKTPIMEYILDGGTKRCDINEVISELTKKQLYQTGWEVLGADTELGYELYEVETPEDLKRANEEEHQRINQQFM